jgi:hypothetical protein
MRINMGTVIDYTRQIRRLVFLTPGRWSVDSNIVMHQIYSAVIAALTSKTSAAACQRWRMNFDNCRSENLNQLVFALVEYIARLEMFPQGVDICFLVKGHTFMTNDSTHSMVKNPWNSETVLTVFDAVKKISETVSKPHEIIWSNSLPDWRGTCSLCHLICNLIGFLLPHLTGIKYAFGGRHFQWRKDSATGGWRCRAKLLTGLPCAFGESVKGLNSLPKWPPKPCETTRRVISSAVAKVVAICKTNHLFDLPRKRAWDKILR